jgi:ribosome-associated heat shock protein Hsp15
MSERENNEDLRFDKWLWAARFFKTRSLAAKAVSSGKVANGDRPQPNRAVRAGDRITIRLVLYEKTEQSQRKRQTAVAQTRLERARVLCHSRPSKRDRRAIGALTERIW